MDKALKRILGSLHRLEPGNLTDALYFLLAQMPNATAERLRLCAIPNLCTAEVLRVLVAEEDKSPAELFFHEIGSLSFVAPTEDGFYVHESIRDDLLVSWMHKPGRRRKLEKLSAKLADYFRSKCMGADVQNVEFWEVQRIFHLVGADQDSGMAEFLSFVEQNMVISRIDSCLTLCNLILKYQPILTDENLQVLIDSQEILRLRAHRSMLEFKRGQTFSTPTEMPAFIKSRLHSVSPSKKQRLRFSSTKSAGVVSEMPQAEHRHVGKPTHWIPNGDVSITEHGLVIKIELAGLRTDDLTIVIEGNEIHISGQRSHQTNLAKSEQLVTEVDYGPFERIFDIPSGYVLTLAKAAYLNGFLRIDVPLEKTISNRIPSKQPDEIWIRQSSVDPKKP